MPHKSHPNNHENCPTTTLLHSFDHAASKLSLKTLTGGFSYLIERGSETIRDEKFAAQNSTYYFFALSIIPWGIIMDNKITYKP